MFQNNVSIISQERLAIIIQNKIRDVFDRCTRLGRFLNNRRVFVDVDYTKLDRSEFVFESSKYIQTRTAVRALGREEEYK
jgi:hypothetical protein